MYYMCSTTGHRPFVFPRRQAKTFDIGADCIRFFSTDATGMGYFGVWSLLVRSSQTSLSKSL